jgi:hypothetical protein
MAIVEHAGSNIESSAQSELPSYVSEITETERGLIPNTRYAMRVRALNGLGVTSNWSEAIEFDVGSDNTIPATPVLQPPSTTDGHITLIWSNVTENTDGSLIEDLAFYEIIFQDNTEYSGELLPPFRYTSISNSYTFLYSVNKAIHDALETPQPPSDNWTVTVRAIDYSGNPSGDATETIGVDLAQGLDYPVNFESSDYNGSTVETHDATDGIRIQENGEAEFNDLRVNGDLYVNNINVGRNTIALFRRDSTQIISDTTDENVNMEYEDINRTFKKFTTVWIDKELVSWTLGSPNIVVNKTGWYRISIVHKWEIDGTGTRESYMLIDSTKRNWGGHQGGGTIATTLNMFTDTRMFYISAGEIIVPGVRQDSGGALDLEYMQVTIELI